MSIGELFLAACLLLSFLALRIGVPCLCTWAISAVMRHFDPQPDAQPANHTM